MTEEAKVALYVFGALDQLAAWGYLAGKSIGTPKGTAAFDQLHASGYRPREDQVVMVLTVTRCPSADISVIATLVRRFGAGRIPEQQNEGGKA